MGHNLATLGTASLDTLGGLITFAQAVDLPEGASPRNWDVDFSVGSVGTRPGLVSTYAYATTLAITGFSLNYNIATFTYAGPEPTVNEGFLLSGFTGNLSFLNGQTVYVETLTMTMFTAALNNPNVLPQNGLSGSAVSTTGIFVGPNIGSIASGADWSNPSNIFSPTGFASVITGQITSEGPDNPSSVSVFNATGTAWTNSSNLVAPSAEATVTLASGASSQTLLASGPGFSVPATATITGIKVTLNSFYSGSGNGSMTLQLAVNGVAVGTSLTFGLAKTQTAYSKGSSAFTWGTSFTPASVNGSALGVLVSVSSASGTASVDANDVAITVYYTTSNTSGALLDQGFGFALAGTNGITGFGVSFIAYSTNNTTVTMQLIQDGVAAGAPKTQTLTSTPTVYTLGASNDLWGDLWSPGNVNNVQFGVQITASGQGTTNVGDLDITTYITAALENFNWIGSYEQNNLALTTLALDAAGNLWQENVLENPGVLSIALTGIIPGSFGNGATLNDSEFIMFSNLSIGTDRPRQLYNNGNFYPVSQVGPGVAPSFQAATGSISGILQLTGYSQTGSVVTFIYQTTTQAPTTGSLYVIAGTGTFLDGQVVIVLSGATVTEFTAEVTGGANTSGTVAIGGTATPHFTYEIASITQIPPYAHIAPQMYFLLGPSPGVGGTGSNVTVWYNVYGFPPDPNLVSLFANNQIAVYVYITGAIGNSTYDFNGVWQVTAVGTGHYPGTSDTGAYFCFTFNQSGTFGANITGASYQLTAATLTLDTATAALVAGTQITITNVTGTPQTGWNNTWTISSAPNVGQYTITSTQWNAATGESTYTYEQAGTSTTPATPGQLITITGATNNAGFNGTFVINPGATDSTFSVTPIPALPIATQPAAVPEGNAQAIMFGTVFTFDPGEVYVGTNTDPIFGDVTVANDGQIVILGTVVVPIGAGTRQAICFFITETGNWTPASPPVTFTVSSDANLINLTNIPIGPANVVGRGVAITEAGQNGIAGANFYVIQNPVSVTVNTVTTTYTSTIINDNISTSAAFSFTDAVLLNSTEVDIPGLNLFNLIELGSSAWCVPYASRMFYGMQLNKVQNFNNLTFDGGYVVPNQPAGWGLYLTESSPETPELQLITSPVTGDAYYVSNTTGVIQPVMGLIAQTAYQDPFNVAIIQTNTGYSVRVAASCPSGVRLGTLVIDLTDVSNSVFGTTYGSFSLPLSELSSTVNVFSGVLLNASTFPGEVSKNLQLRMYIQNMGVGADCLVDRLEVYPTLFPYLNAQVYGSYAFKPEAIDASVTEGGIIDTTTENAQTCFGGFVMRDNMYLLKTSSMYFTKANPNSEPGGWSLTEVSNRVGAVGINAYHTGEEWAVMGCRAGLFGFDGSKPEILNLETLEVWKQINWNAGNSIVIRNDINNRRILCAVPLPTGTSPTGTPTGTVQWLPYAPYNPAPTTPNVMLILNYQSIGSFQELLAAIGTHATMFGSLSNPDMRRKWTIWQIPSPYMDFITRANYIDTPLYICNGIDSSKIYELDPDQLSDDGAPIYSSYCTYGFVNAVKAATLPIFGLHVKRYTLLQLNVDGSGTLDVTMWPNTLQARYPYSIPLGITLADNAQDDYFRSVNVKGQRMFLEVSTDAVGSYFQLNKALLTGKQDAWSSVNPTGGGNAGIY